MTDEQRIEKLLASLKVDLFLLVVVLLAIGVGVSIGWDRESEWRKRETFLTEDLGRTGQLRREYAERERCCALPGPRADCPGPGPWDGRD